MRVFTVAAGIPRMCAHSSSTTTASAWGPWTAAFVQRLRELGWIEGRTVTIEYRWAEARSEHFAETAAEFVRLKVDVIVTGGNAAAAAKQASSVVPIVFVLVGDPLGTGLVASLARRGVTSPACRTRRQMLSASDSNYYARFSPVSAG
jgi:ABC transporter substrate binding protein